MTDAPARQPLTLSLNAAEGLLELAVSAGDGALLYGLQIEAASRGVELLVPTLHTALTALNRPVQDIARIAVVHGPGSFTGLRLVTTTAAGLARTTGAMQAGLNYMDALAEQVAPLACAFRLPALLWVLVRARRDLLYLQAYILDGEAARPATTLATCSVASGDAEKHIREASLAANANQILCTGSGVAEHGPALAKALLPTLGPLSLLAYRTPTPATLARMAHVAHYGSADIEPLYVRSSDAETNLPQIAQRLGLDPEAAVRKMHQMTHSLPEAP